MNKEEGGRGLGGNTSEYMPRLTDMNIMHDIIVFSLSKNFFFYSFFPFLHLHLNRTSYQTRVG